MTADFHVDASILVDRNGRTARRRRPKKDEQGKVHKEVANEKNRRQSGDDEAVKEKEVMMIDQ